MPKVLEIKNIEQIKKDINNFFSINEDARFVRRLDIIALICNKHPINYVADLFGIDPTTVQRWVHRLNESGFEWRFERLEGDAGLVVRLLNGEWTHDEFLVVEPGHTIKATNQADVVKAVPFR